MLVLTRSKDEGVILTDKRTGEILGRISVGKVLGANVKLGFKFSADIQITRDEIACEDLGITDEQLRKYIQPRMASSMEGGDER